MKREDLLPDGWESHRLIDLCLGKGEYGANAPKQAYKPSLPRYVRITDISASGSLQNDDPVSLDEKKASKYLLSEGDVLVARSGATVGKSYMYRATDGRCAYAGYLIRFRPDNTHLLPDFLRQYLQSASYWDWVATTQRALAQPNINAAEYGELPVPTPPLPEQRKIAAILSSVDDAIEKTQAVIDQLAVVKHAMMAELLTRGLPGRHKRFKQTEIGEIPESWEVVQLAEVAQVQTGIAKNKKTTGTLHDVPYLRVANVQDGYLDLAEIKTLSVDDAALIRYRLQTGDVLFTEGGDADKLGRGCVWEGQIGTCLHQNHVFAVRTDQQRLAPKFLSLFGGSPAGKAYFLDAAKQTTNLASINSTQLKALPVPLPRLDEQDEIVAAMDCIGERIAAERGAQNGQHALKTALMNVLLTGELRVTPDEEAA